MLIQLPTDVNTLVEQVIDPSISTYLPPSMLEPNIQFLLALTSGQESGLRTRYQVGGPARGLWQFEINGVLAVMNNPASTGYMQSCMASLGVAWDANAIFAQLAQDDTLACLLARLTYWTLPNAVPATTDIDGQWLYYIQAWNPGAPNRQRWNYWHGIVSNVLG